MSFSLNFNTSIGMVRVLISDTDSTNYVLEDEEINIHLKMTEGNVYHASSSALGSIINNQAKLNKKIKAGDYEEDPKNVISGLKDQQDYYYNQAISSPADCQAEQIHSEFAYTDFIYRTNLRGNEDPNCSIYTVSTETVGAQQSFVLTDANGNEIWRLVIGDNGNLNIEYNNDGTWEPKSEVMV